MSSSSQPIDSLAHTHRYTDFLVNEILPSGEVVHLDNLKAPPKPHKNTELLSNAGEALLANNTEQKAEAPPSATEQIVKEQEKSETVPQSISNDEQQTLSYPDKANQEHPTFQSKEESSVIEALQAIPQSMQGFDKHDQAPAPPLGKEEKISPHKRIPPPAPSIPLSMQDLDSGQPEPKQEKTTRRTEKVYIRQTSQGWIEFDKEKEDETKKRKNDENIATGLQTEGDTTMKDVKPEEPTVVPESKEADLEQIPKSSTQASWQAFAGSAPGSSFQVSNQSTQCDMY